jgi:hypothetical protein
VLVKTDHRQPQKEMENAAHKARNVADNSHLRD